MSAIEFAKSITKLVERNIIYTFPKESLDTQQEYSGKCMLAFILKFNSSVEKSLSRRHDWGVSTYPYEQKRSLVDAQNYPRCWQWCPISDRSGQVGPSRHCGCWGYQAGATRQDFCYFCSNCFWVQLCVYQWTPRTHRPWKYWWCAHWKLRFRFFRWKHDQCTVRPRCWWQIGCIWSHSRSPCLSFLAWRRPILPWLCQAYA